MKLAPNYFTYFTHSESPFFNMEWMKKEDLSWIDELNKERALEKEKRISDDIKNGDNPNHYFCSDEKTASKDFNSIDFPSLDEYPDKFKDKYNNSVKISNEKLAQMVKTANQVIKIDDVTLYIDCEDNKHYFKTQYYSHGALMLAAIDDDSAFDSVDTAIYAFINDYKNWQKGYGQAYKTANLLSELDALHAPVSEETSCAHEAW